MTHYIYKIIDPITNEFYIGSKESEDPENDGYLGSYHTWEPEDINRLEKFVLLKGFSGIEVRLAIESALITTFINHPKNRNYYIPTIGFHRHGLSNTKEHNEKINIHKRKPVLRYDLDGVFIDEWESIKQAGINLDINIKSISDCCIGKNKSAGGFVWRHKKEDGYSKQIEPPTFNNVKPVLQYDRKGNFINEWEHAKKAGEVLEIDRSNISECCTGKRKTIGNYQWRYKKSDNYPNKIKPYKNDSAKPIVQYTKNGEFINGWKSMSEASRETGTGITGISKCCLGKLKTSGGFKWEFK